MFDDDVARGVANLQEPAIAAERRRQAGEEVLTERDVSSLPRRAAVVVAEQVDARRHVAHDVALEAHVLDHAPRAGALRVARREHDRVPGCDSFQWFSKMFSSMTTLRAFFSSNRFLTDQTVPADVGTASAVPGPPVSVNAVPVTVQYLACAPAERP